MRNFFTNLKAIFAFKFFVKFKEFFALKFFVKFKEIFALPKWAKIFILSLSIVAFLGLCVCGVLQIYAKDKEFNANLTFHELELWKTQQLNQNENPQKFQFSYKLKINFEILAPLLRSKTISRTEILDLSFNIDESQISHTKAENRYISFISTQDLGDFANVNSQNLDEKMQILKDNLQGKILGTGKFKVDFSPLYKTILIHYFSILCAMFLLLVLQKLNLSDKIFSILIYALIIFAAFARIYQYIFHKDLWLDEASVAFSFYGLSWDELFLRPLPMGQSVPFLFLVLIKAMGEIFSYNEYMLYFVPCLCGILSLFLSLKIAEILFGKNSFGALCFVVLVCGSASLLYYSAEFKQYGVEAFFGFLLVFLFLKGVNFRAFFAVSVVAFLSSHTGIFIALSCWAGVLWRELNLSQSLKNAFKFSNLRTAKTPIFYTLILCVLFLIYYFAYVKFQASSGFYDYWKEWFLPWNLAEIPAFFVKILDVFTGFVVSEKKDFVPFYMLISCVGFLAFWRKKREFFVFCATAMLIYVALDALHIYPIGHASTIGGRLSLFMAVVFFTLCAAGANFFYEKFTRKWLKMLLVLVLLVFCVYDFKLNVRVFKPQHRHIQQTHEFISQILREFKDSKLNDFSQRKSDKSPNSSDFKLADFDLKNSQKCVFIYNATKAAFLYYSHLDGENVPYSIFGTWQQNAQSAVDNLKEQISKSKCTQIWLLASHYPEFFDIELINLAKNLDKNAQINRAKTGWGSILIKISRNEK